MFVFVCPRCKKDFLFIGISILCDDCDDELKRELYVMKRDLKEKIKAMKEKIMGRKKVDSK